MLKFSTWLEAMFNKDTSNLEGDPYMDIEWKEINHHQKVKLLVLKISYRWKGYSILPHQKGYAKPDEFANIELYQLYDHPDYFYMDAISTAIPFQREGYATALVNKALGLIKDKGFKGIVSGVDDRTQDASDLWKNLKPRRVGEYDVYE